MAAFARVLFVKFRIDPILFGVTTTARNCSNVPQSKVIPSILQSHNISSDIGRKEKVSKAMKAYLERAKQHDEFMKARVAEFEIGRRHLANMMGEDPDTFTQADIDRAIQYLMPSGMSESRARPVMKHPDILFPKKKEAEFDVSGRPFHYLFYTGKPNFYSSLHIMVEKMMDLDKYEDQMNKRGIVSADASLHISLAGTDWISQVALEKMLLEKLNEFHYKKFITTLTRLVAHPYSIREKEFIMKFRVPLVAETESFNVPPLKKDENGRPYMDAVGTRKTAVANVVVKEGTGKIEINGTDIDYFSSIQDREQLMFPLQFTGLIGKVDVMARVSGGGHSAQAGSIRHGISLSIRSFLQEEVQIDRMRLAGLLTKDPRRRERKKVGQKGARAKYTWKKR